MVCCRCNKSGYCRNCACIRAGKSCQGCLSSRLNKCSNISLATRTPTNPPQAPPTPVPMSAANPTKYLNTTLSQSATATATGQSCIQTRRNTVLSQDDSVHTILLAPTIKLPDSSSTVDATFTWGNHTSIDFKQSLDATYSEVIHWGTNLFKLP